MGINHSRGTSWSRSRAQRLHTRRRVHHNWAAKTLAALDTTAEQTQRDTKTCNVAIERLVELTRMPRDSGTGSAVPAYWNNRSRPRPPGTINCYRIQGKLNLGIWVRYRHLKYVRGKLSKRSSIVLGLELLYVYSISLIPHIFVLRFCARPYLKYSREIFHSTYIATAAIVWLQWFLEGRL